MNRAERRRQERVCLADVGALIRRSDALLTEAGGLLAESREWLGRVDEIRQWFPDAPDPTGAAVALSGAASDQADVLISEARDLTARAAAQADRIQRQKRR